MKKVLVEDNEVTTLEEIAEDLSTSYDFHP